MSNQQAFKLDILQYRYVAMAISGFILLAAAGMYLAGKRFVYSVDFTGGTQVQMQFARPVDAGVIHGMLSAAGWERVSVRNFGENNVLVRTQEVDTDSQGMAERMRQAITAADAELNPVIMQNESVGGGVGAALRYNFLKAIILTLIILLLYILIRFWSLGFALGAVLALVHDGLIMLAVFLLLGREVSIVVIGAILAMLGYSINDTIVIFSQIRSNLKKMHGADLYTITSTSIDQTLRRTMLTSISTGLPVLSMLIFGGEVLRDISIALLIGVIFGTSSSIFIASPIMMFFTKKK
jgi:preprotein translocase SecF subunit